MNICKLFLVNVYKIIFKCNYFFFFQVGKYITSFDNICEKCAKITITSYTFIEMSKKNLESILNALSALTQSLEHTTNDLHDSKSLFLSLNLEDCTNKQLYDCVQLLHDPEIVLKRFKCLQKAKKIKPKIESLIRSQKIKKQHKKKEKKSRRLHSIPTSSMLFDEKDQMIIKCKECLNIYPTLWSLRNHYIRVHAPKNFKCSECSRSYGSQGYLDAHRKESHCEVICSECGKTFYNRHTLKMHEMGHYLSIICPDCGRVYKNKSTFKKHKEINICSQKTRADPSQAKYTCDYCNKKYTQKMSLRVHIQYEHGNYKAHICEWCGKKFWAQSRLKAHIVKHTKEKNFKCNICGGKFVSKESLLYHTRIHTGEKPYECPQCNSKFLSASRRSQHIKHHHIGPSLECDICCSKFNSRSLLQKHRKIHVQDDSDFIEVNSNAVKVEYVINEPKSLKDSTHNKKMIDTCQNVLSDDRVATQGIEAEKKETPQFMNRIYGGTEINSDGEVYIEMCDSNDYVIEFSESIV